MPNTGAEDVLGGTG